MGIVQRNGELWYCAKKQSCGFRGEIGMVQEMGVLMGEWVMGI